MIFGALGAFTEKKIKKFLAYSSINQVGFLLLGFSSTNTLEGIQSTIYFLIIYVATNILFFYFFLQIESTENSRPLIYLVDLNRLDPQNYKVKFG
jgi:NADH-quinone oxidoreductase subunit N